MDDREHRSDATEHEAKNEDERALLLDHFEQSSC